MRNPTLGRHARNAHTSLLPEEWKNLKGLWVPALGNQGSRLVDISSTRKNGSLIGMNVATDWVVGENGYALRFNPANGSVDFPDESIFFVQGYTVIISLFYRGGNDWGMLFVTKNIQLYKYGATDNIGGWLRGPLDDHDTGVSYDINAMQVVAMSWDGSNARFYKNGTLISTVATINVPLESRTGAPPALGAFGTWEVDADIDHARFYDKALSGNQIKKISMDVMAILRPRPAHFGFVGGGGGPTLKSIAEAAGSSESLQIAVSLALSELGSGGDTPKIDSAVQIPDTGSGSESPGVVADIPVSESGFSVESIEIPGQIGITDSGSATETINVIAALAVPDTGSGVEIIDIAAQVAITENGTGSEALKVDVTLALTELGLGLDTLSLLAAIAQADTGAGTEGLTANTLSTTINIIEVITGAETLTISADLSIPENGSALEALWVNTGIVAEIIRMAAVVMTVPTMANITMTVPQMSNVIMTV